MTGRAPRGGYASSDRTAGDLPAPPEAVAGPRGAALTRVELTCPPGEPRLTELRAGGRLLPFTTARLELSPQTMIPELTVTLPVIDGMVTGLDATVKTDAVTRDALVAMGWTPPPDPGCQLKDLTAEARAHAAWLNDVQAEAIGDDEHVRLTHLPAGISAEASGPDARDHALLLLAGNLLAEGHLRLNDARAALDLPPLVFKGAAPEAAP